MESCKHCGGDGYLTRYDGYFEPVRYVCQTCKGTGRTPVEGPPKTSNSPYPYPRSIAEALAMGDKSRVIGIEHLWKRWKETEAKTIADAAASYERAHRQAIEREVMGTDNLAKPVYRGIDYAREKAELQSYGISPNYLSEWDSSTHSYDPTSTLPPTNGATNMNSSTAIFLVTDKVRAIRVSYDTDERNNNPGYLFKTFDSTIAKDDLVVVPTNTRHGFTICKVVEVDVDVDYTGGGIQYKWIAGKFDPSGYEQTLANEQDIIDKVNRAERNRKRAELAAALKIDESEFGSNPLLLAGTSTTTTE